MRAQQGYEHVSSPSSQVARCRASTATKYCNGLSHTHRQVASDAAPHAQATLSEGIGLSLQAGG